MTLIEFAASVAPVAIALAFVLGFALGVMAIALDEE